MDFFEEQALARKRTLRLVLLFAAAVVGVVVAVYFLAMIFYTAGATDAAGVAYVTGDYDNVGKLALSFWDPGVLLFAVGSTATVVGLGSLYKIAQLRDGGPAVALSLGGRKVDPDSTKLEERRLLNVVEEMAIASGVPVPEVYVLDREPGINAFAAGNTTSDAVIGVTQGTLQLLRRDELQGVVAHEFSHILNGDSRINLRAIGLLHGIFLLALIGRFLTRGSMHSRKKGGGGVALIGLGLLAIGSIGVFFGRMIQSSISRQRRCSSRATPTVWWARSRRSVGQRLVRTSARRRLMKRATSSFRMRFADSGCLPDSSARTLRSASASASSSLSGMGSSPRWPFRTSPTA
jgi:Zn-dependent protease with chaperone function